MSTPFNFEQINLIMIRQLLPFCSDFEKGPVVKKLQEVFKEKKKRQEKHLADIIHEVVEANKCQSIVYKRRGKRIWLGGLFKAEPEEELSISIRGHYVHQARPKR